MDDVIGDVKHLPGKILNPSLRTLILQDDYTSKEQTDSGQNSMNTIKPKSISLSVRA